MVKTLIHEAAHVLLHQTPPAPHLPRAMKEVEAESVAYVVASVHGMATDDYSFPYVAGWAGKGAGQGHSTDPTAGERGGETHHRRIAGRAYGGRQAAGHRLGGQRTCGDLREKPQKPTSNRSVATTHR